MVRLIGLRGSRAAALLAAVTLLCSRFTASPAAAQLIDPKLWGVNGSVDAIVRIGDRLYLGGAFTTVGPNTGGGAPLDRGTGVPSAPFPRVAGRVSAVVSDGGGGWFIGGHFTSVEGEPRENLAHILADGSVSPWHPSIVGVEGYVEAGGLERRSPGVSALALRGNTLYVGGRFSSACDRARNNLAGIDATTGELSDWDPNADDEVRCLVLAGNTIYVGGEFRRIGEFDRHHIAALNARTGQPTAWNPDAEYRVRAIAVDGPTVYAGGDFVTIGGRARGALAALDATTGEATPWNPDLAPTRQSLPHYDWIWPYVSALAVRGHSLFVGGSFSAVATQRRRNIAEFDTRSGVVTGFAPAMDGPVFSLVPAGNVLYAGGDWYSIDGVAVPHIAAFDLTTDRPTSWNPRANAAVEALAVDATSVYAGGSFTSLYDRQLRNGLAALDLSTGEVTDWDPKIDGYRVYQLAALGDTLYLAGVFKGVGGYVRGNVAAVDARTGAVTSWDPGPFGIGGPNIRTIGGFVYLSGGARYFARYDPVTAVPDAFDARLDGTPDDWVETNGIIYLAGNFVHVGGQFRPFLAAIDASTAELLPWNPEANPDQRVFGGFNVLAVRGSTIYVGGNFSGPPWFPRVDLAAVDDTTGALLPWDPHPTGDDFWNNQTRVGVLTVRGNEVWTGGDFKRIGGEPRLNLAVLDATSGVPAPIRPDPDGVVGAIVTSGDTVYVGGAFRTFGGSPHTGIVAMIVPRVQQRPTTTTATPSVVPAALSLSPCRPNPLRSAGVFGFSLPRPGPVNLAVYDMHGRRVATILDGQTKAAGFHEAPIQAGKWAAGVYYCRLESLGFVATRKFIVVN